MQWVHKNYPEIQVGIDEAGRGPLCGPVVAAAVILPTTPHPSFREVKDSKKLKEEDRKLLSQVIKQRSVMYGVGIATVEEIDTINILEATYLAMNRALDQVRKKISKIDVILVDGNRFKPTEDNNDLPYTCIIKGDNTYYSIAAASILAKVTRDRMMNNLCLKNPILKEYSIHTNKGYGSKAHRDAIEKLGITSIHRKTFEPCVGKVVEFDLVK